MRHRVEVAAFAVLLTTPLTAQEPTEAPPLGTRVRIWEATARFGTDTVLPHVGRLAALDADSLAIRQFGSADPHRFPIAHVVRLDVSRGGYSRRTGAWRGATVGALVLLAIGLPTSQQPDGDLGLAVLLHYGAPIALGGGALIGALTAPGERWTTVSWPAGGARP